MSRMVTSSFEKYAYSNSYIDNHLFDEPNSIYDDDQNLDLISSHDGIERLSYNIDYTLQ